MLAFGSPVSQPLSGSALSFPTTTVGNSSQQQTLTLTANEDLTISSIGSSSSQFTLGTPSPALPATLTTGQTISVPVTFSPTQTGLVGGQVNVSTDAGNESFAVSGTGQSVDAQLTVSPSVVSLGGTAVGSELSGTAVFSNQGSQSLKITKVDLPAAPFTATGLPSVGDTIAAGATITVDIAFDPTQIGAFTSSLELDSDTGGNQVLGLAASAGTAGFLQVSSQTVDFGGVPLGTTASQNFTITNSGGTNVTITKSKPPYGGAFAASTSLSEGTTITPGQTVTETVTFTPTAAGPAPTGTWDINGDDGSGAHQVQFTGSGVIVPGPPPILPTTGSGPPPITHHPLQALTAPKIVPNVATTAKVGSTYFTYTAAVAGTTHFTIERETVGRRSARRCVPTTARNRRAHACTYYVNVATFTHRDQIGTNRVRFAGLVSAKKLVPGTYRLQSVLTDAAGVKHTFYTVFRVTLAPPNHRHRP